MKRMRWLAAVLCFCLLRERSDVEEAGPQVEMEPRVEMRWGTRTLPPVAAKTHPDSFRFGKSGTGGDSRPVRGRSGYPY